MMPLAALAFFARIGGFLKAIPWQLWLALALVGAFAFMWWRIDVWQGRAERYAEAVVAEKHAHDMTRVSLELMIARAAAYVADGERRTKAASDALAAQRARSAALDTQIARLRSTPPTAREMERCETPVTVRDAGL